MKVALLINDEASRAKLARRIESPDVIIAEYPTATRRTG